LADTPIVSKLRKHLDSRAGTALPFSDLSREEGRLGFLPNTSDRRSTKWPLQDSRFAKNHSRRQHAGSITR